MFSDAVAHELFKTAAEVSEIEDESAVESSRRKKRALIGAGLTAAALGGLALGAYSLSKPVETMGENIDKSILPKERGAMATVGDTAKSVASGVAGPAGIGMAAGAAGGLASRFMTPIGPKKNDIMNLTANLLADGDDRKVHSWWREFGRGMRFSGDSQVDVANRIRTQLGADPSVDVDKMRRGLAGKLTELAYGDPSAGALGSRRSLVDIANRPLGVDPSGKPLNLTRHLQADLDAAAKLKPGETYHTNVSKVLRDLSGPSRGGYPGSIETFAESPLRPGQSGIRPQSMDGVVNKLNTLVEMHEVSEAARNKILSGSYTPHDVEAAARGELARKILGDIGAHGAADSKDSGGKKGDPSDKPGKAEEKAAVKRNADIARGVKAVRTLTREVGGTTRGVTRNLLPRMLGGGTTVAGLSSVPYVLNSLFPSAE